MFFKQFEPFKKYLSKLIPASDCLLCCEKVSSFNKKSSNLICQLCHERLPKIKLSCPVCAMPSTSEQTCGACLKESPYFHKTISAFHYEPPVDQFISQLKFNGRLEFANLLSDYLLQTIQKSYIQQTLPDFIIPVPLHHKKITQRGFNQSQIIANRVAKSLQIPLDTKIIERVIYTKSQSKLNALAREKNLRGAFRVNPVLSEQQLSKKLKNKTIVIVDDVMTTGTTVNELSKVLLKFNVNKIHIWSVARAYAV